MRRRRSASDKLLVAGDITWLEWRCLSEFRNFYDQAFGSQLKASRLDGTGRGRGYRPNLQPSEHRLMALRRLHDLQGGLDRKTLRLLEADIVDELSWCELGRRLRVHAFTAKCKGPAESGVMMAKLDHAKPKAPADAHLTDLRTACETTFPGRGDFAFCTAMTALWSFPLETYEPGPLITKLNLWLLPAGWRSLRLRQRSSG